MSAGRAVADEGEAIIRAGEEHEGTAVGAGKAALIDERRLQAGGFIEADGPIGFGKGHLRAGAEVCEESVPGSRIARSLKDELEIGLAVIGDGAGGAAARQRK